MRVFSPLIAGLLFALPVFAREPLIQLAPASDATLQLVTGSRKDDPLDQAAKRASDNPWQNSGNYELLAAVRQRDEIALEQAFMADLGRATPRDAIQKQVPFERPPNGDDMPMIMGMIGPLTNAVLRANMPCGSIYAAEPLGEGMHGWALMCDGKANFYAIALVGKNWKLTRIAQRSPSRK